VQRLEQGRVLRSQRQQLVGQRAVPVEQVLHAPPREVVALRERVDLVDHRRVTLGADQRYVLGDAVGDTPADVLAGSVHGIRGHHPVGRVLASRDRDEPRLRPRHGVLA
jgi:hypothetical protein